MKRLRLLFFLGTALVLLAASCTASPATAPATQLPTQPPAPTEPPVQVPTLPTQEPPAATLAPISLAGPEMTVGSTWPYVDGSVLVAVPGGEFIMGRGGSDNPVHTVSLGDFWIYRTKVTIQQYQACARAGECTSPNLEDVPGYSDRTRANDPITGVNWEQAEAYCTYVHGRLPTEAEWEKTARGPEGNIYPWGDQGPSCGILNFNNCVGKTTNVNLYPQGQSYYQAFDMEGNAFEWVADWYDPIYYKSAPVENPLGPEAGTRRSIRSTGYKSNSDQAAASVRFFDGPRTTARDRGFRCVVEDPTYYAPYCEQLAVYGMAPDGIGSDGKILGCDKKVYVQSAAQSCKVGSAYVTFDSSDPAATPGGIDGCTLLSGSVGSFPLVYECWSPGTATIDALCDFSSLAASATCAPHFILSPDTGLCKWDGTGAIMQNCPTGYAFDPALQCCKAQPVGDRVYPVCAVSSTLVEDPPGAYKCVASGDVPPPAHAEAPIVLPVSCGSTGDNPTDEPGSCNLYCDSAKGWELDPKSCQCVCRWLANGCG